MGDRDLWHRELGVRGSEAFRQGRAWRRPLVERLGLASELAGHRGCVNAVTWNAAGTRLISGSDDLHVLVWDPWAPGSTLKPVNAIKTTHETNIFATHFLPQSGDITAVSGAGDSRVYVHDLNQQTTLQGFHSHLERVKSLAVAPDSPHLIWSSGEDGMVIQMDLRIDSPQGQLLIATRPMQIKSIALNPVRPDMIAVGGTAAHVSIYDRRFLSLKSVPKDSTSLDSVSSQFCTPYQSYAPALFSEKKPLWSLMSPSLSVTYVSFSADGQELLVNYSGKQIYLFNLLHPSEPNILQWEPSASAVKNLTEEPPAFRHDVEALKFRANNLFKCNQYNRAIELYNEALLKQRHPILLGNRAAALMKRKWSGDEYAALRDCFESLELNPKYVKSHLRAMRILLDLKQKERALNYMAFFADNFPDQLTTESFKKLKHDISESEDGPPGPAKSDPSSKVTPSNCQDFKSRFVGHCNETTDIKQASFCGPCGQQDVIVAGSDGGSIFFWDKNTTNLIHVLASDSAVTNCVQPHPSQPLLASSGIDNVIRLWSPLPEDGRENENAVDDWESQIVENQNWRESDHFSSLIDWSSVGRRMSSDEEHEGVMECLQS
ncbi:hypothetical protein TCAL_10045 [Tigriopus californicus]|uniref:WD and tetratricopeptide repeats protein 1 n=1 Tax=Tigriopus californicus TaxID=6832 RepID=A0A553PQD6_TIGCA|nr:WD and tetratricopeptide repeats protein 1-like [Tigriopus californicus]TRY79897.1 hypothetical protein TCAL_10045 [Tigriopus californicus]|eukprot:TCALIF_10045-PA protein Name:"Similar to Wdtc1 WD and tetratricopeptide repeats protein 1 (Mus musculus)" AED:0.05 eAED:0.05 QI:178/1/1/1/1/1/2/156/604